MPRPSTFPTLDTNGTRTTAPLSANQTDGFTENQQVANSIWNWLFHWIYLWIVYLDDIATTQFGVEHDVSSGVHTDVTADSVKIGDASPSPCSAGDEKTMWASTTVIASCRFSGGASPSVGTGDHNVSSVNSTGAGRYTVNFDQDPTTTNYIVLVTVEETGVPGNPWTAVVYARSTATFSIVVQKSGADTHPDYVNVMVLAGEG